MLPEINENLTEKFKLKLENEIKELENKIKELKNKEETEEEIEETEEEIKKVYHQYNLLFRDYKSSLEDLSYSFEEINNGEIEKLDNINIDNNISIIETIGDDLEFRLSEYSISFDYENKDSIETIKNYLYQDIYNTEIFESSLKNKIEEYNKIYKELSENELIEFISNILIERIKENGFKEKEIDEKEIKDIAYTLIEKENFYYYNENEEYIISKEKLLNFMKYLKEEEIEIIDEKLEKYTKEAYKLKKELRLKREEIEDRLRKTKDDEEKKILKKILNKFENNLSPQEMAILKKQLNGIDFMTNKIKDQLTSYFK